TPKLFEGMTFEDYKTTDPDGSKKQNVLNAVINYYNSACLNYLYGYNLILIGNPGTGKTMLSSILANMLVRSYFQAKFINIVDMFEEIKATFNNTGKIQTKEYIDNYKNAEYLFIDDLDKKKTPTDYVKETLYAIFNYRVENQLPIVISANSDLTALDKIFDEVIISRLVHKATVVLFTHGNERLKR
ncbi:MAG: ATP-binding protein, partial [Candidatus Gastranaerophilales bacterium]|nr:ATP-binding protein [Candidatus Gastranaerophilales bacterium]